MIRRFSVLITGALVALLLIIFALPALAQTPSETTVNMGGFVEALAPLILQVASVIAAFFVAWLSAKIAKLTGIQIEAKHREALQSALTNGASYGINQLGRYTGTLDIDVKNKILAEGIRYVQRSVPDAIAHFGLTPEKLKDLLEAKLPKPATVISG